MNRVNLSNQSKFPHFIGSWMIESASICDELIAYFELNNAKHERGVTAGGVNLNFKNSLDISIPPKDLLLPENKCLENYFGALFECYLDYAIQWPFWMNSQKNCILVALISKDTKRASTFKKFIQRDQEFQTFIAYSLLWHILMMYQMRMEDQQFLPIMAWKFSPKKGIHWFGPQNGLMLIRGASC